MQRPMQGLRLLTTQAKAGPSFVELREYTLKPEVEALRNCAQNLQLAAARRPHTPFPSRLVQGIKEFVRLTNEFVGLRKELLPFLGMWTCDTGGVLNRVLHLYEYDNFDQRDSCRKATVDSVEWQQQYLANSRKAVEQQESTIFEPTTKVLAAAGVVRLSEFRTPPKQPGALPVYELRRFHLQPGYDGLPLLTAAYQRGIGHKIAAAKDKGSLIFFGHSSVGLLDEVIEFWRFGSAQACMEAREASRANPEWRATVAAVATGVQKFSSSFLHPLPFSPLQ